jgi:hypothetical protein
MAVFLGFNPVFGYIYTTNKSPKDGRKKASGYLDKGIHGYAG